jgi:hypothetical protein
MFTIDGDMAGAGAATDPLFYVAHGSVERLLPSTTARDGFTDISAQTSHFQRHRLLSHRNGTKAWLEGFINDRSIKH